MGSPPLNAPVPPGRQKQTRAKSHSSPPRPQNARAPPKTSGITRCRTHSTPYLPEPVGDPSFAQIIRRHLHPHPVTKGETDKALPHFAGNVREDEMFILELDPEHCSGE